MLGGAPRLNWVFGGALVISCQRSATKLNIRGDVTMKHFAAGLGVGRLLAICAAVVAFAGTASADPVAVGSVNVDFQNGEGTLSGYFQTDASGNVSNWDLQTSEFNCNPCTLSQGFPGTHYTPSNSTAGVGFLFGQNQTIDFFGTDWALNFVIDCGGNGANCIGGATLGSSLNVTGNEFEVIDQLPFRSMTPAVLTVTDPPVGFSFNFAPTISRVPEPATLALLALGLAGLGFARRKR